MNNILLTLTGALILALAALFVGPYFIDWNSYRTVFEEQATRLAGRTVSVEGNVNLRLLPAPYVSFERVKIADRTPGSDAPLLEIENYTLWLAVPPLLQGDIEARAMEIDRPTLRLALNGDGSVNWSGLGQGDFDLPFVPRNVAFRDTHVSGGRIEVRGANGDPVTQFANISGTFTARALTGPFKFLGDINQGDAVQTVRWSTGRFDESGGLRVKGTVKNKAAGTTYAVDGLLQKIMTAPVFTGGFAGKLRRKGSPGFEMKADIYADTSGAQFNEITLLLDAEGRPQIVNGDGTADWQGRTGANAKLNLTSRWLDIDRLQFVDGEKKSLITRIDAAQKFLARALPESLTTTASFKATQISFGGEALDDVDLTVTRRGSVTRLDGFSANLPGAAKLAMTGELVRPEQSGLAASGLTDSFKGKITIRGRTLSRLASWMKPEWGSTVKPFDGAFALSANIMNSIDAIQLQNVKARLGETRITGSMRHGRDTGAPLKIVLESPALDLTRYAPDAAALGTALRTMTQEGPAIDAAPDAHQSAAVIKLNIGELQAGDALFADVRVDAQRIAGKLHVKHLEFSSARGFELEATRDASRADGESGSAPLRFVVRAHNKAAYDELIALSGVEAADTAPDSAATKAARAFLPAHVAGSLAYEADGSVMNIRYDGMVSGNRALGRMRIEGDDPDWSARNWTVSTDIALEKPASILKEIGLAAETVATGETASTGRVALYAIGRPKSGLETNFSLQVGDVTASFSGSVESASGGIAFAGDIEGQLKNNADIARLMMLDPSDGAPVAFAGKVQRTEGKVQLTDLRLTSRDAVLSASAQLLTGREKIRATLAVEANQISLSAILGLVTPQSGATPTATAIWPETPFDFSRLNALEVLASVKSQTMTLADGVTLTNAAFELSGDENGITLTDLKASAGEGTVTGEGKIERRPAGAQVVLSATGTGIRLDSLAGVVSNGAVNAATQTQGVASFDLSLDGVGLSPKGVVSVMQGEGQIATRGAALEYFSPQVVQDVAADIADDNASVSSDDLKSRIAERLADRRLDVGAQSFTFRIRDGALQADPIRIATPAAAITATTFVDIARLRLDSEWRITPKPPSSGNALPPVTVFYAGDVRKASAIKPGFGVAALERELTVRRLEGNIDQLEGLQSLRIKKRTTPSDDDSASSARGTLRPTIGGVETQDGGGEAANETRAQPVPPKPSRIKRRKQSTNEILVPSGRIEPPIELKLQTPEGANPT